MSVDATPATNTLLVTGDVTVELKSATASGVTFMVQSQVSIAFKGDQTSTQWSAALVLENNNYVSVSAQGSRLPLAVSGSGTLATSGGITTIPSLDVKREITLNIPPGSSVTIGKVILSGRLGITTSGATLLAGDTIITPDLSVPDYINATITSVQLTGSLSLGRKSTLNIENQGDISGAAVTIDLTEGGPSTAILDFTKEARPPASITFLPQGTQIPTTLYLASGTTLDCSAWEAVLGTQYSYQCQNQAGITVLAVSPPTGPTQEPKSNMGLIIGIAVGVILIVLIVIIVIVVITHKKKQSLERMKDEDSLVETDLDEVVEFRDPENRPTKPAGQDNFFDMSQDINPWAVDKIDPALMFDDESDI